MPIICVDYNDSIAALRNSNPDANLKNSPGKSVLVLKSKSGSESGKKVAKHNESVKQHRPKASQYF